MSDLLINGNLPLPRLELSWHEQDPDDEGYNWRCDYDLVMGLRDTDIRRGQDEDGNKERDEIRLSLGGCRSDRGRSPIYEEGIDTPYRDGAHAQWDSAHLGGIPIFVTCGDHAMRVTAPAPRTR